MPKAKKKQKLATSTSTNSKTNSKKKSKKAKGATSTKGIAKTARPAKSKVPVVPWGSPERLLELARGNADGTTPASIYTRSLKDRRIAGQSAPLVSHLTQVKYGPGEGMRGFSGKKKVVSSSQGDVLEQVTGRRTAGDKGVHENRLTAYSPTHSTYVEEARRVGRPLTEEEQQAAQRGGNADNASINHIVASGVGQNLLNMGIAQGVEGQRRVQSVSRDDIFGEAGNVDQTQQAAFDANQLTHRKRALSGLAMQAAAVGRQQMYSRAILNEREPQFGADSAHLVDSRDASFAARAGADNGPRLSALLTARSAKLKETVSLMDPGSGADSADRMESYKHLMKTTFDSPGNLRVGQSTANTKISTGFDPELGMDGLPTPRTSRLFDVHAMARPEHDERIFTTYDNSGDRLSSSSQVSAPTPASTGPVEADPSVQIQWGIENGLIDPNTLEVAGDDEQFDMYDEDEQDGGSEESEGDVEDEYEDDFEEDFEEDARMYQPDPRSSSMNDIDPQSGMGVFNQAWSSQVANGQDDQDEDLMTDDLGTTSTASTSSTGSFDQNFDVEDLDLNVDLDPDSDLDLDLNLDVEEQLEKKSKKRRRNQT